MSSLPPHALIERSPSRQTDSWCDALCDAVRNAAGVKLDDDPDRLKLVVDEDDELRNELEIPKDFIFLGGRQSYVVDASGTITCVHNNQFDTDSHVTTTLEAAAELPAGGSSPFDGIELPKFELPDFSSFFGGAKEEE